MGNWKYDREGFVISLRRLLSLLQHLKVMRSVGMIGNNLRTLHITTNHPSTYRDATHFAHETWDMFAYRIWFNINIPMPLANANFVLRTSPSAFQDYASPRWLCEDSINTRHHALPKVWKYHTQTLCCRKQACKERMNWGCNESCVKSNPIEWGHKMHI